MTIRGWEREEPYKSIAEGRYDDVPDDFKKLTGHDIRPQGIYGASKIWGEAIGRHFSDAYGMSVLCVRIGRVTKEDRPYNVHEAPLYLSQRDVSQILHRCIDAESDLKYDIFMCTSDNRWGYRDLTHPREILGYEPEDSAEGFS
jgi:nucleoside-diphosphate-sugar epimerase